MEFVRLSSIVERRFDESGTLTGVIVTSKYMEKEGFDNYGYFDIKASSWLDKGRWTVPVMEVSKKRFEYSELDDILKLIEDTVATLKEVRGGYND